MKAAGALGLLLAMACDDGLAPPAPPVEADADAGPRERVSLVDHQLWQELDATEDPFADRPDVFVCSADGHRADWLGEELVYDVETGACEYLSVRQNTLVAVEAGDLVSIRIWHFDLRALEPAEAHVAIRLGDAVIYQALVPIPSEGALLTDTFRADARIAAGTDVTFHLHNHGDNSWAFVELSTGPEQPE